MKAVNKSLGDLGEGQTRLEGEIKTLRAEMGTIRAEIGTLRPLGTHEVASRNASTAVSSHKHAQPRDSG